MTQNNTGDGNNKIIRMKHSSYSFVSNGLFTLILLFIYYTKCNIYTQTELEIY